MNQETKSSRTVVEAEIKPFNLQELQFPKVDMEPARRLAEQVLLTGIGVGVLLARGLAKVVNEAHAAGESAAKNPGPVTQALLSLVHPVNQDVPRKTPGIRKVPVLPIADYVVLSDSEVIARLEGLSFEQLNVVRAFEEQHLNRPAVLAAITSKNQAS
jgi:hypothetical protein